MEGRAVFTGLRHPGPSLPAAIRAGWGRTRQVPWEAQQRFESRLLAPSRDLGQATYLCLGFPARKTRPKIRSGACAALHISCCPDPFHGPHPPQACSHLRSTDAMGPEPQDGESPPPHIHTARDYPFSRPSCAIPRGPPQHPPQGVPHPEQPWGARSHPTRPHRAPNPIHEEEPGFPGDSRPRA